MNGASLIAEATKMSAFWLAAGAVLQRGIVNFSRVMMVSRVDGGWWQQLKILRRAARGFCLCC